MPHVSVIIPAYNPGSYLATTVQSVINQTFTDWELIIVDDGSTENFSSVVDMHPAIRLIRQENRGLSIARNVGLLQTHGNLIAFLDSDDVWGPEKLAKQVAVMDENAAVGLCHTQASHIDAEGNVTGPGSTKDVTSYIELLSASVIYVSSVMIRRECLAVSGLFDPMYISVQDYDMWIKISRYYQMKFIPSTETFYRIHGQNMSKNYYMVYQEGLRAAQKHLWHARRRGDKQAVVTLEDAIRQAKIGYGCQAFDQCRSDLKKRDYKGIPIHFWRAVKLAPKYTIRTVSLYPWQKLGLFKQT